MQNINGEKQMEENNQKTFRTKDLGEASALLAKRQKLLFLEKDNNFYWFVFEFENCYQLSNLYWFGELLVNAKTYNDSMKTLKDRLFAQKG